MEGQGNEGGRAAARRATGYKPKIGKANFAHPGANHRGIGRFDRLIINYSSYYRVAGSALDDSDQPSDLTMVVSDLTMVVGTVLARHAVGSTPRCRGT